MKMLKRFLMVFALLGLAACSSAPKEAEIDLGKSEIYTEEEREEAIVLIREEFDTWEGCELQNIRYAGDSCNSEENIQWMNDLKEGKEYTECIEFLSDFHSPKEGGGSWEPDKDYKDWTWYLARKDKGPWELITWGY